MQVSIVDQTNWMKRAREAILVNFTTKANRRVRKFHGVETLLIILIQMGASLVHQLNMVHRAAAPTTHIEKTGEEGTMGLSIGPRELREPDQSARICHMINEVIRGKRVIIEVRAEKSETVRKETKPIHINKRILRVLTTTSSIKSRTVAPALSRAHRISPNQIKATRAGPNKANSSLAWLNLKWSTKAIHTKMIILQRKEWWAHPPLKRSKQQLLRVSKGPKRREITENQAIRQLREDATTADGKFRRRSLPNSIAQYVRKHMW